MANMLLMDVNRVFDHLSRNELIRKMEAIGANGDW